jgi:hypothetical protein
VQPACNKPPKLTGLRAYGWPIATCENNRPRTVRDVSENGPKPYVAGSIPAGGTNHHHRSATLSLSASSPDSCDSASDVCDVNVNRLAAAFQPTDRRQFLPQRLTTRRNEQQSPRDFSSRSDHRGGSCRARPRDPVRLLCSDPARYPAARIRHDQGPSPGSPPIRTQHVSRSGTAPSTRARRARSTRTAPSVTSSSPLPARTRSSSRRAAPRSDPRPAGRDGRRAGD